MERREVIAEFFARSTWHGVSDLFADRKNKCLVSMWALCICTAFAFCGFSCYEVVYQYLTKPTEIHLNQVNNDRYSSNMEDQFQPDILICPLNRFSKTKVDNLKITSDLLEHINAVFVDYDQYDYQQNEHRFQYSNTKQADKLTELIELNNLTFTSLLQHLSHDCADIFNGSTRNGISACQPNNSLLTPYGKCYVIKTLNQRTITMAITVPDRWFEGLLGIPHDGIGVWAAYNGRYRGRPLIKIPRGVEATISLRPTCYKFNPALQSMPGCNTNKSIKQMTCYTECIWKNAMEKCQCRILDMFVSTGKYLVLPICTPQKFFGCLEKNRKYDSYLGNSSIHVAELLKEEECYDQCTPCSYCSMQMWKTVSPLMHHETPMINRNTVYLTLHTPRNFPLLEEIRSKSWGEFISQIGGQLGLWVGGSVLSVVQLLLFMTRCCWLTSSHIRKNSEDESNSMV